MIKTSIFDRYGKEKEILSETQLMSELSLMANEDPFVITLFTTNHGLLTIGVGEELGFIQHSDENRSPPYLAATESPNLGVDNPDYLVFLLGNTLTQIPRFLCLSMPLVRKICFEFLKIGALPDRVEWTPVR